MRIASLALGVAAMGWACRPSVPVAPNPSEAVLESARDVPGPGMLVPDIDAENAMPRFRRGDEALHLAAGLRVALAADGRIVRSRERFDGPGIDALELPDRLGGGFVFVQSSQTGTKLWRADGWTADLRPLVAVGRPMEVLVGFDRLLLRGRSDALLAVDARDGAPLPLDGLPVAPGLGAMHVVDGWRAVIDADLLGPVVTFDAGRTWRTVPGVSAMRGLAIVHDDPVILTGEERVRVAADGSTSRVDRTGDDAEVSDDEGAASRPPPLLGTSPLRTAAERGVLESTGTVLVARRGALGRVTLPEGRIVALDEHAYPDANAECQGVSIGDGVGFVCTAAGGPTRIVRFRPPFALEEWRRFDEPRFVASSGNGHLVVRGACTVDRTSPRIVIGDRSASGERRRYCLLDGRGGEREVEVSGEAGTERVVALRDGRAVVVVPPRPGAAGRVHVIEGAVGRSTNLAIPEEPEASSILVRHGLWLDGAWEDKGAVGAWVEGGGRVLGVRIGLDGGVTLGAPCPIAGDVLFSGRFALAVGAEAGFESVDGGRRWSRFALPRYVDAPDAGTRGCTAVGCALRGWTRLGWLGGGREDDPAWAPEVPSLTSSLSVPPTMAVRCETRSTAVGRPHPPRAPRAHARPPAAPSPAAQDGKEPKGWSSFVGTPPPALPTGATGVGAGTGPYGAARAHVFVWGRTGSDWLRTGSWEVRFEQPFPEGPRVRTTRRGRSPWPDADAASDALGVRTQGGYVQWVAHRDPGGDAALVAACRAHLSRCELMHAAAGEPPVLLAPAGGVQRIADAGAVRVGKRWYFLVDPGGARGLELWRADAEETRAVGALRRPATASSLALPSIKLTRRADGARLALIADAIADDAERARSPVWSVVPLDPETAEPTGSEQVSVGPLDRPMRRCAASEDGWLLEVQPSSPTRAELAGATGPIDSLQWRWRLNATRSCVDSLTARAGAGWRFSGAGRARRTPVSTPSAPIPMTVVATGDEGSWSFDCVAP